MRLFTVFRDPIPRKSYSLETSFKNPWSLSFLSDNLKIQIRLVIVLHHFGVTCNFQHSLWNVLRYFCVSLFGAGGNMFRIVHSQRNT